MCDLSNKGSEMSCKNSPESDGSISSDGGSSLIKTCADCGTTKTPLWRGGPDGPKSLCNACGIRSRKKRRAVMEIRKDDKKQMKRIMAAASSTSNDDSQSSGLTISKSSNMGDFCLKMVLQKPRSKVRKQTRKLGEEEEEEEAAFLLMALSCGSTAVF